MTPKKADVNKVRDNYWLIISFSHKISPKYIIINQSCQEGKKNIKLLHCYIVIATAKQNVIPDLIRNPEI